MSIILEDGTPVNETNIGDSFELLSCCDDYSDLSPGRTYKITGIDPDGDILFKDDSGDVRYISQFRVDHRELNIKLIPKVPVKKTSLAQREELAKAVKEARKALDEAIANAEEVGMAVEGLGDLITYQAPQEVYEI